MEIKSFRIKNFRSIKNSGICNLSGDNITIIAGMNESGKTAILEALEDFNEDKEIREEMGLKGKEIIVNFSKEIMVERIAELYKELMIQKNICF